MLHGFVLRGKQMKKIFAVSLVALALAACGQQASNDPAASQPQAAAVQNNAALCHEPMDIQLEQLLLNMDAGLKSTGASSSIRDQNIKTDSCGYQINMMMDFGLVQIHVNEQQQVLSLGAGYENSADVISNTKNAFAAMQVLAAPFGKDKAMQTEAGKKVLETATQILNTSANSHSASQSFNYDGNLYTITKEGTAMVFVVRKQL